MEMTEPLGLLAARQFVEWGARVFPAFVSRSGEKVPLLKGWPDNAVGREDGSEGMGKLVEWYSRYPYAWVGIACGVGSFLCLDADRLCAVERLRELVSGEGMWEAGALVARTPGRDSGLHVYWKWPTWMATDFSSAKVRVGEGEIEIRGNRHFVLAAGARRSDGEYEILEEPAAAGPSEPPRGLVELLLSLAEVNSGGSYNGSGMEEVSESEAWSYAPLVEGRKNLLAGVLWYVAIRGGSYEEVLELGMRFSEEVCSPPLDEELVVKKAEYTFGRAQKRRDESRAAQVRTLDRIKTRGMRFGEIIQ